MWSTQFLPQIPLLFISANTVFRVFVGVDGAEVSEPRIRPWNLSQEIKAVNQGLSAQTVIVNKGLG